MNIIINFQPIVLHFSNYILLLGALRRLKDWHNAQVTVINPCPSPDTEFLQKFTSADVILQADDIAFPHGQLLWRGKVTVCDKIVSRADTLTRTHCHGFFMSSFKSGCLSHIIQVHVFTCFRMSNTPIMGICHFYIGLTDRAKRDLYNGRLPVSQVHVHVHTYSVHCSGLFFAKGRS